jgi:O-antigen/teichoic acid export membrane protein
MSLLKKLAGETAIYGLSSILGRFLHYILLTPYLTRVFSTEAYGIISDLYAYVALLLVIFTYRMETTFFRYASRKETKERAFETSAVMLLVSTLVLTAIFLFFTPQLAELSGYERNPEYLTIFIGILALDALAAIPFARLRMQNKPWQYAGLRLFSMAVNICFLFFFLELCPYLIEKGFHGFAAIYREEFRIGYVFLSNLMGSLLTFIPFLPAFRHLRAGFDLQLVGKMIRYTAPLILSSVAGIINQYVGTPLLKYLGPGTLSQNLSDVGIFNATAKIAVLMTLFTQAFNYAAEPFFFKNAQRHDANHHYSQVALVFTLVGSIIFLGILSFLDLISVLIGPNFRSGLYILPYLLLAYLFLGLFYCFSIWCKLVDKTHVVGTISSVGTLITLVLNIILIPRIGMLGPAIAACACYFFMAAAAYITGKRQRPIPYDIKKISIYIGSALLGYGALMLLPTFLPDGVIYRILGGGVIFSSYLLFLLVWERKHWVVWIKQKNI